MKGNKSLLDDSERRINECIGLLKEVSSSCCMPERSANMNEAFLKLDSILTELKLARDNEDNIQKSIHHIGELGKTVGFLFATCCTTTREPLYQNMYRIMNDVHGKLYSYLGHSH